jgi:hypothetical protein
MANMPSGTRRPNNGNNIRKAIGIGMSPETAAFVSFWANWVLLGTLIVGALATGTVIITGIIKDRAFDEFKLGVAAKVADATKAGIGAGEAAATAKGDAANAQLAAAQANERAATLEKEAAVARLETERLKGQVAWRELPEATASRLREALSKSPSAVNIQYVAGDPEAVRYAAQFVQVFRDAHWNVAVSAETLANAAAFGLRIPDDASPDAEVIRRAFNQAGIPFSNEPLPPSEMSFTSTIAGAPRFVVASKPPPAFAQPRPSSPSPGSQNSK